MVGDLGHDLGKGAQFVDAGVAAADGVGPVQGTDVVALKKATVYIGDGIRCSHGDTDSVLVGVNS
jgi:hypothetical protein